MTPEQLDAILSRFPHVRICVVGDLFLDKYYDIDSSLSEISLETGLAAYQITRIRCYPGAAGTIAANLAALGVGQVAILSLVGEDGEGYDARQALRRARIDDSWLQALPGFQTPTYTKPMLLKGERKPAELNRLDLKNRHPLAREAEDWLIRRLEAAVDAFDAIIIADQVQERNCGIITDRLRLRLGELAGARPDAVLLADSRCRIGEFQNVIIKPNQEEALAAVAGLATSPDVAAALLSERTGRPVYLTLGSEGLLIVQGEHTLRIPAYRASGDIDIVGAGDSTMAGIAATLGSGGTLRQAGLVGCLVASLTIQQIGVTGTASPQQVRQRLVEYRQQHPAEDHPELEAPG